MVNVAQSTSAAAAVTEKPPTARLALTVDEAAATLGVNPWTIRRAIYAGEIASFKVRGRVLIRKAEIERVMSGATA